MWKKVFRSGDFLRIPKKRKLPEYFRAVDRGCIPGERRGAFGGENRCLTAWGFGQTFQPYFVEWDACRSTMFHEYSGLPEFD